MIGVVGLGNMGRAIAERLEEDGQSLSVWNRSPAKAEGLAAQVASTPADVAAACDVVLSVLANDAATEAVYFGAGGLLSADLAGRVIVEFCTMTPERSQALEAAVTGAGGMFLECPVGGTIGPARQGKLLGLAGGSEAAFALAQPVLARLTRRLEHLGPVGRGAAMKLSINLPLMVYWTALGEALHLAMAEGIDPSRALDILVDSSGAVASAKNRVPPIREMVVNGDPGRVSIAIENGIKDMQAMEAVTAARAIPNDVIAAARARAELARDNGFAGYDMALVAAFQG